MKYSIITFGCRVNQADSLELEEQFLACGATPVPTERADIVVVNTCSVTSAADQGARQTIRRIARQNPNAQVVVTGCYATRQPAEAARLPAVVQVVANSEKQQIAPSVLHLVRADGSEIGAELTSAERFGAGDGPCGAAIEPGVAGRTGYTLRVQTGCDEPCAYCIIPTTRGSGRSRPIDQVLRQIDRVVQAGFKEIALTGVHLGSYGRDLAPRCDLLTLLQQLDSRRDDVRFRISSLEPMDCTRDIVDLVWRSDCFAPHFHLPLQHASDSVLEAMRRPYTVDAYRRIVDDVRSKLPNAAIGSDILVGFPGETERDAELLLDYLIDSPLTHLHVFPYSDRPGTEAAGLAGQVSAGIARERAREVRRVGATLTERFKSAQVGGVHRGLTIEDGSLVVTGNYLKVRIPPGRKRNEWVDVRVTAAGEQMIGELYKSEVSSLKSQIRSLTHVGGEF